VAHVLLRSHREIMEGRRPSPLVGAHALPHVCGQPLAHIVNPRARDDFNSDTRRRVRGGA